MAKQVEQGDIGHCHLSCEHRLDFILRPDSIYSRQSRVESNLIGAAGAKAIVFRVVLRFTLGFFGRVFAEKFSADRNRLSYSRPEA
jgi:hypothetical protein